MSLVTEQIDEITARGATRVRLSRPNIDSGMPELTEATTEVEMRVYGISCLAIDDNPTPSPNPELNFPWNDTTWSTPFCQRFVAERDRIVAAIDARDAAEAAR